MSGPENDGCNAELASLSLLPLPVGERGRVAHFRDKPERYAGS